MVSYDCELCDYTTNIKPHHIRHRETNKHIDNMIKYGNEEEKLLGLKKKNTKEHKKNTKSKLKEHKKNTKEHKKNTKEHKKNTKDHKKNTKEHKKNTKNIFNLEESNTNERISCDYCDKDFKTRHIMLRHARQYCKIKKDIEKEEQLYKDLIETQSQQISKLIEKVGNKTTINANIQNIQNNTNNNIELNYYGKEDLSMLTDKVKNKMIKGPFTMIPRAMKMIYFSKKYPENRTLKLINRKENILQIHKKNGWEYVNKDEIINEIIDNTNYEIDIHYDNTPEQFSNFVNKTYKRFRELYDSQDTKLWMKIKKDVDLILWNNM